MAISDDFSVFTNFHNTINGKQTSTAETRHGINPATGEPNPEVPVSTQEDVDKAVAAAQEAFKSWSETPVAERKKAVLAFADGVEKYAQDFAKLLVQEQGKPDSETRRIVVRHTPIGVSVGITPWNFPVHICMTKLIPAVLTGNVVIIKPSPYTPYCGLKLVELAQRYFPPGVVQALSGADNLGPMLTAHPGVDKISFTGSSATGKKVMESASKTLKRVTLELGGNDAAIVCKNVDVESVAAKVASMGFLNSGQICVAIKRIYVHADIYDRFLAAAAAYTKTIQMGAGTEDGVFMGPIQNSMQYEKAKSFFADIPSDQLALTNGGVCTDKPGYFIRPTIIDRPAEDSRIATEEPFGPILPFMVWRDEQDVIARANNTRMGLGASVWSDDLDEAARIAGKLQAGNVWVNTHLEGDSRAPFSGHKESGIGTENGIYGLRAYCNLQTLYVKKTA
ncbi:Aldehyde/histidinol dehydrogenase [Aspergillus egyptiacus]|nr:Aldehyde/histidinol dehydrogenase [Aspergillus egyptiacus]